MRSLNRMNDIPAGERFANRRDLILGLPGPVDVHVGQCTYFSAQLGTVAWARSL